MSKKIPLIIAYLTISVASLFPLKEASIAPGFANPDLDNHFVLSKDVLGNGWIILDFFATYCEPCKKELPEMDALVAEKKALSIKLIVISLDQEGEKIVRPYFDKHPTQGTVLLDRYKTTAERYGVTEIPKLFLIGPDKKIVKIFSGFTKDTAKEIRKIIDASAK